METHRAVALGFFDGVHIGHGALLQKTRQRADELGIPACAMSFDASPLSIIGGAGAPLLSTMDERTFLMKRCYGIDEVVFAHFDQSMMQLPWEEFIEEYLVHRLNARHVVCGHDYRFGYRGEGTPARLMDACRAHGIGCDIVPEVDLDGIRVSSTAIRAQLAAGDTETARRFLGHPHLIRGTVVHGQELGRTIGVPTANIPMAQGLLIPPYGVYCAMADLDTGAQYPAVVNIGVHPTAGALPAPVTEAWISGLDESLYGRTLNVWLYRMLRREQKFDSLDALRAQVLHDRDVTLQYCQANANPG